MNFCSLSLNDSPNPAPQAGLPLETIEEPFILSLPGPSDAHSREAGVQLQLVAFGVWGSVLPFLQRKIP